MSGCVVMNEDAIYFNGFFRFMWDDNGGVGRLGFGFERMEQVCLSRIGF